MNLLISEIDEVIRFDEGNINSIIIENQNIFRKIIQDIVDQINGLYGNCVLSRGNIPVSFEKNCEIMVSFVPFEINRKSIINHIIALIEKTAMNEVNFQRSQKLLAELENFICDLSFENDYHIEFSKLNISSILKAVGVCLQEDYENIPEKIIDYMEIVKILEKDKLFITVNMRSYFSDEEIRQFMQTAIAHKTNILMIENMEYDILENEKRIVVDKDMCIF